MIPAYPLQWPEMLPRSRSRESGRFDTSLAKALENVETSIRRFGADSGKNVTGLVLSSNCTLGSNRPDDPGVAAWFTWDGMQVCIAVDRYSKPESNLQAIHHIIEARRTELRHGTLALVRATFRGFQALPPPPDSKPWREVLGFGAGIGLSSEDVMKRYRQLAAKRHPDKGGSDAEMSALNKARDQALAQLGN